MKAGRIVSHHFGAINVVTVISEGNAPDHDPFVGRNNVEAGPIDTEI